MNLKTPLFALALAALLQAGCGSEPNRGGSGSYSTSASEQVQRAPAAWGKHPKDTVIIVSEPGQAKQAVYLFYDEKGQPQTVLDSAGNAVEMTNHYFAMAPESSNGSTNQSNPRVVWYPQYYISPFLYPMLWSFYGPRFNGYSHYRTPNNYSYASSSSGSRARSVASSPSTFRSRSGSSSSPSAKARSGFRSTSGSSRS